MLKGKDFTRVREAIVSAYDGSRLDMFLYEKLEYDRPHHVPDGSLNKVVSDVVKQFQSDGKLALLVDEVARDKPHRKDIQRLRAEIGQMLVDESWDGAANDPAADLQVLARYGLAAPIALQSGAHRLFKTVADSGFQELIHPEVGTFDAYLWAVKILQQTHRVCRIDVDHVPRGTGFLVGPDTLLTNHHVLAELIAAQGSGSRVRCVFNYVRGFDGIETEQPVGLPDAFTSWHLDSSAPLTRDEEHAALPEAGPDRLDHALVRLAVRYGEQPIHANGPKRGWIWVPTAPVLTVGMPLGVLHHPNNTPLQVSFDTHGVQSINPGHTRLRYATNTEPGSSGSPCFDKDWGLVALHHFGDPIDTPPKYNQGVPIAAIRQRLTDRGLADQLGPRV